MAIPKFWALEGVDGDLDILDEDGLAEFFAVNETIPEGIRETIRNLEPGVAFRDGGGSSPEWQVRRMTADECADGGWS